MWRPVTRRVPQGSIPHPSLFNTFTKDPKTLTSFAGDPNQAYMPREEKPMEHDLFSLEDSKFWGDLALEALKE